MNFLRSSHSCCCTKNDEDFCKSVDDEKLREPIEPKTKLCSGCLKLFPKHKFTVHGRMKKIYTCVGTILISSHNMDTIQYFIKRYVLYLYIFFFNVFQGCTWLRERNIKHINYDHYVFLLNCVRSEERKRESTSAISFIMQKHDMYHLVNNIWHGHSAVSENTDLFLLRIVRYNMKEEWSPWNCILLTEEEAAVHSKIENLADVYSKPLIERVFLAHQLAKNQFKYVHIVSKIEEKWK